MCRHSAFTCKKWFYVQSYRKTTIFKKVLLHSSNKVVWVGLVKLKYILTILLLTGMVMAVPQEVCNTVGNGHFDPSFNDCKFNTDPGAILGAGTWPFPCSGTLSKYISSCVGPDYYDYSGVVTKITAKLFPDGVIRTVDPGQCLANILPNDPRCATPAPQEQPQQQPLSRDFSFADNSQVNSNNDNSRTTTINYQNSFNNYPSQYPYLSFSGYQTYVSPYSFSYYNHAYCGNFVCEYGENSLNCPMDCGYFYNDYYTYHSFQNTCSLSAIPQTINAGGSAEISISYFDAMFSPLSTVVDCGNGQVGFASGCTPGSGLCFATCNYPSPGNYFVNLFSSGTYCSPTSVNVLSGFSQLPPGNPGPVTFTPPVPTKSCTTIVNPPTLVGNGSSSVTLAYSGFTSKPQAQVICGNGQSNGALCSNGVCNSQCNYDVPAFFPAVYNVQGIVDGIACAAATINQVSPKTPISSLSIIVKDSQTLLPIPNAVVSLNGNSFSDSTFTDENGFVFFPTLLEGSYTISASKKGYAGGLMQVQVNANEADSKTVLLDPIQLNAPVCGVIANPTQVRGSNPTQITVNFDKFTQSVPTSISVQCGDGNIVQASCSTFNQTPNQGQCIAQCAYSLTSFPQTFTASANVGNVQCSSSNVKVNAPVATTGSMLLHVTSCNTGGAINGALVSQIAGTSTNASIYSTDKFGEVLINNIDPTQANSGGVLFSITKNEFSAENASPGGLQAGTTITKEICLTSLHPLCDFTAALVNSNACFAQGGLNQVLLKVTNNLNTTDTLTFSYNGQIQLKGPNSIQLNSQEASIIALNASSPSQSFTGGALASISVHGSQSCSQNIDVPVCFNSGISIEAEDNQKTIFGGEKACFSILVRNRGASSGTVFLNATQQNGLSNNFNYYFEPSAMQLKAFEMQSAQFCVQAPGGATVSPTFTLTASSPINDASTSVSLNVLGGATSNGFATDFSGCRVMDDTATASDGIAYMPVSISNNAESGDYALELGGNPFNASFTQNNLYNFQKGTAVTAFLKFDLKTADQGEHHFLFNLKKDSQVVYSQDLCVLIGTNKNSLDSKINNNNLVITQTQGGSAKLILQNEGNVKATYVIQANSTSGIDIQVDPSAVTLESGEKAQVDLHATSSNAQSGTYNIPVNIYAKNSQMPYTYYYNYYNNYYNNGGNNNLATTTLQCGDGQVSVASCQNGGTGSCTFTCSYANTGSYTPSLNINGLSCTMYQSAITVVSGRDSNTCYASVAPVIVQQGNTASVTVNYFGMNSVPNTASINCGNGNTVTATGCNSISGSCTATCSYSNLGLYNVVAQVNGISCGSASVYVVNPSQNICLLGAVSNNLVRGESTQIIASYWNLGTGNSVYNPYNNPGNYPYPYLINGGTSSANANKLIKTENLVVSVSSASQSQQNTLPSDSIQILAPPISVKSDGTAVMVVDLKNKNSVSLENLAVTIEGMPSRVIANPVLTSLAPGEEKSISIQVEAVQAKPGNYQVMVKTQNSVVSSSKQTGLQVVPQGNDLGLTFSQPVITFNGTKALVSFAFAPLQEDVSISRIALAMPAPGWNFTLSKTKTQLQLGEWESVTGIISIPNTAFNGQTYQAKLQLTGSDGRNAEQPFDITTSSTSGIFSGLFVLGSASNLLLLVVVILVIAGMYMIYQGNKNVEEAEALRLQAVNDAKRHLSSTR